MIIALTGKHTSGKDTAAKFLETKGFEFLSLSDEIRDELKWMNKETSRENEVWIANKKRKEEGSGYWAKRVIKKMKPGKDYVVVSLRNPAEVEQLRKLEDFKLVFMDASPEKRWELMQEANSKNLKNDYADSWDEFKEMDEREANNEDPAEQQLDEVIKMADVTIKNEGTLEELQEKINGLLQQ